jgi:cytoskeletal protein CcmA (bactofilin family)
MFNRQEVKENFKDAETVIGPSVTVKGNFNSTGNIVVEGVLKGGIKTAGNVFIGDQADITADIEAKSARIGGTVKGNIKIEGSLQVVSSAKIFGDIECSSLAVEPGSIMNGKVTMSKDLPVQKEMEPEEENEK